MKNQSLVLSTSRAKSARPRDTQRRGQLPAVKPVMLLVLGMHRSGTSVCARMLECLGAVPSRRLMNGIQGNNAKGFFEDVDVYEFNERELLPRLRRAWHSVAATDWSQLCDADRSRLAMEALKIIRANYSPSNPLSVLKEPRLGKLLPFWLSVLTHAGFDVRVVCAVRDPVSVAQSLNRRDQLSVPCSGLLFVSYWLSILGFIGGLPVAFVHFDEVMAEPRKVLEKAARALSLPIPKDFPRLVSEFASDFLDKSLHHHRHERADLELEPDMPPLALDLYRNLVRATQSQHPGPLLKFAAEKEKELTMLQPAILEFDRVNSALCLAEIESEKIPLLEKNKEDLEEKIRTLEADVRDVREARLASDELVTEKSEFQNDGRDSYARARGLLAEKITLLDAAAAEFRTEAMQTRGDLERRLAESEEARGQLAEEKENLREELGKAQALAEERTHWAKGLEAEQEKMRALVEERTAWAQGLDKEIVELRLRVGERLELEQETAGLREELGKAQALVEERTLWAKGLEAEQEKMSALVEERTAWAEGLDKEVRRLRDQRRLEYETQQRVAEQRFEEIGKLTRKVAELEADLSGARALLASEEVRASRQADLYFDVCEHHAQSRGFLAEQVTKLAEDKAGLRSEAKQRFEEIGKLTRKVAELETDLSAARSEVKRIRSSTSWRLTKPLRALGGGNEAEASHHEAMREQMKLIKNSGLFDRNFYLRSNPDVARLRVDPIKHFILHGAAEGRNPSAAFNTRDYLKQNPELLSDPSIPNPLVHFIRAQRQPPTTIAES